MGALTLSALAAIGSLVGTGVSAGAGAIQSARAREDLKTDFRDMIARYDRLLNRNYVDSPENAGLMRRLGELQRENYNRGRATNVVAGGTDAHLAAMQLAGGKVVSDTGNAIAQRSQAYKDKIEDSKYAAKHAYAKQMFGLDQQQAQTIANAGGQVSKAMAGIAAAGQTASNPYDLFGLGTPDPYMMGVAQGGMDAATAQALAAQDATLMAQSAAELDRSADEILKQKR